MSTNIATLKSYQEHSLFESVEEKDAYIRQVLYNFADEITDSFKRVLLAISGHACKVVGVSWLKHETIAENEGLSVSTVKRAIRFFEKKGVLQKVNRMRERMGGKGANIYIITKEVGDLKSLPDPSVEPSQLNYRRKPESPSGKRDHSAAGDSKDRFSKTLDYKKNDLVNDVRDPAIEELDSSFVPSVVPQQFVDVSKPFFNAKDIFNLWGCVQNAYKKTGFLSYDMDMIIKSFKETVFNYKRRKIKTSFNGYFYGTVFQKLIKATQQLEIDDHFFKIKVSNVIMKAKNKFEKKLWGHPAVKDEAIFQLMNHYKCSSKQASKLYECYA